ncbi:LuxR C-terminal-related transcriptional regulator [Streptomyces sp. RKAG290]|uniref:helix-turn-helix transcriptional regulator n=1 Tax=Streptomyces sp. RKAG290 TaxID=2888348 RepID=UPI0020341AF3|nr:LuxR C-terminal-related transcriptional regulator [Streptomyces sp. RKAG290]MCM2411693.1 LuxR C-terminal-related transcriptional regulator [Streptomyces sp. RKAG290]
MLLDGVAVDAYAWALRKGVFDDEEIAAGLGVGVELIAQARETLHELRLLGPVGSGPTMVPLNPDVAEAELVTPLEVSIAQRRQQIAGIHRQLRVLAEVYRSHERSATDDLPPIRVLDDFEEVRREIDLARRRCTEERISLQPGGGRSAEMLEQDLMQTLEMRRRGIRIRTLYQHTARSSLATRTYVRQICEEGAEVRTAEELAERLIIYDRKLAFIPKERTGKEPPGAAIVSDPTLVAYLCRSFESVWQGSQPFDVGRTIEYQQVAEDLRMSILRLMAMGVKDEVIARRLGMATRTCRRHISAIMEEIGATSRFQAGLLIGRQGLIPDDQAELPVFAGIDVSE